MNSVTLKPIRLKSEIRNLRDPKWNVGVKYTGEHLKHSFWNEKHIWSENIFEIRERKSGVSWRPLRTPTPGAGWFSHTWVDAGAESGAILFQHSYPLKLENEKKIFIFYFFNTQTTLKFSLVFYTGYPYTHRTLRSSGSYSLYSCT